MDDQSAVQHFDLTEGTPPNRVFFGKDDQSIISLRGDTTVEVFDLTSASLFRQSQLEKARTGMPASRLSADGAFVFGAMRDGRIRMWSLADGKLIREFTGHTGAVFSIALSADDKYLASGGDDGTARVWDVASGKLLKTLKPGSRVSAIAFAGSADRLVTAGGTNPAILWSVSTGLQLKRFEGHTDGVLCMDVSPDGHLLATGTADNTARTWILP